MPEKDPSALSIVGRSAGVRLLRWEEALTRQLQSAVVRKILLLAALGLFLTVTAISIAHLPSGLTLHWGLIPLVVLILNPAMLLSNAAEYRVMAMIAGHHVTWSSAARLTILASATNLLPAPGGVMVRTQALHAHGAPYRRALAVNAIAGLAWVACGGFVVAALLAIDNDSGLPAVAAGLFGAVCLMSVVWLYRRADAPRHQGVLLRLLAIELLTVCLSAARLYIAFLILDVQVSPAQATLVAASIIVAAAIGIFPAGLGLREGIAGLIGVAVQIAPSTAVAATAFDRLAGLVTLTAVTGLLVAAEYRKSLHPRTYPQSPREPS